MDVSNQLAKIVRAMGARFSLNGRPMTVDEVLGATSLLPAIARSRGSIEFSMLRVWDWCNI